MDPRLLRYYNREIQHLREMGAEFAQEFPKIAGRLGLSGFECADPYVERLLEGFAFLAARVQLKLDAEFPRFTQHLLEMVYPHYLAPTPSMTIVQFQPRLSEGALAAGHRLPRHTALRSILGKDEQTACEYRTAHDVTLWPIELAEARYFLHAGPVAKTDLPVLQHAKGGIRLRLRATAGLTLDKVALDSLVFYLHGSEKLPAQLYEQILGASVGLIVQRTDPNSTWQEVFPPSCIRPVGFQEEQALLPYGPRSFEGYRLLQEYFAFPNRYLFFEISGLARALRRCEHAEADVILLLGRVDADLESLVDVGNFALFCSPAINLFPRRADRIHLTDRFPEHHLLPDRTRPMDFEVYQVTRAIGIGAGARREQEFLPFYSCREMTGAGKAMAYYTVHRAPRVLSSRQRRQGSRSSYVGSEVFLSIVDGQAAPYRSDLKELAVDTLCTNRDLPLHMPVGISATDFTIESGAPVESVRCLAGPSAPRASASEGDTAWRLISHLSLNYLSLLDTNPKEGAAALRQILSLYANVAEPHIAKQIEGVKSTEARPITHRLPSPGPITFGRGLQITVTCDEAAFEGSGVYLLGAVLEQFFAKYVSINSFTKTVLQTPEHGEVMQWPARIGRRQTL